VVISNCVINLSADKPRVLAEAFRVLRPGGRLGISDVTADDGIDPGPLAEAERRVGCGGTPSQQQYRDLLLAAGFTSITITSTHEAGSACTPPSSGQPSQPPGMNNHPVSWPVLSAGCAR
jgi:SAM-dependent methyltransferase